MEDDQAQIQAIIKDLEENIYCRLKPSTVSGVGVFAIRDIPKGTDPFKNFLTCKFYEVDPKLVFENDRIDPVVKGLFNEMWIVADGKLSLWSGGLNSLDMSFFVNHSKAPNMVAEQGGAVFVAGRDIKGGEELFVDYGTYAENKDEQGV